MGGKDHQCLHEGSYQGEGHHLRDNGHEFAHGSRHKKQGEKSRDGGYHCGHYRRQDLLGTQNGSFLGSNALFHIAIRVFGNHDGIVHDDSQHQDEAEHGDHIEGDPEALHEEQGTGEGDRDPQGGHPGNPKIEEDAEDHEDQDEACQAVPFERVEPILDVYGSVVESTEGDAGRKAIFILSDELPHVS